MAEVSFNENGLSSRENRVLKVIGDLDSRTVSTATLKLLTGFDQKVIHKTIQKLLDKGYIEIATVSRVRFYKPDRERLEEVLGSNGDPV